MLQPWTCHCGQTNLGPGPCSACLNAAPPHVVGAEPIGTRRWRPGPSFVATAIVTVVLLVAGLVSAVVVSRDSGDPPADEPANVVAADAGRTVEVGPDTVPGAGASELERLLPELVRFVQDRRGLPFTTPVKVTLLADDAFRQRLRGEADEESEEDAEDLRTTQRVLEGLGLLERGVDLEEAVESLYGDAVAGFYDTDSDELVVRGDELSAYVRTTLVHELVHALQDQHFDIDRDDLDERDDEAVTGLQGLVEGDAVRIERLYLDSLSDEEHKAAEREELEAGSGIDPGIPRVLLQLVAFPYIVGPTFATTVFERGGQERLDQAFREPPATSEHLLHPLTYLEGETSRPVSEPEPEGGDEAIDEGVLGELGLLLVLNASGASGQTAAAGWGGDRYVAWSDDDDTCVRVRIAMDTPQDDAELRRALDRLADSRDGVEVEGRGPFLVTSCG